MIILFVIALAVWLFGKFVATKGTNEFVRLLFWVYIPFAVMVFSLGYIVYYFIKKK